MVKSILGYLGSHTVAGTVLTVCQVGGAVHVEKIRAADLDAALQEALAPWRTPLAVHDTAETVVDLAIRLALGGDAVLRPRYSPG